MCALCVCVCIVWHFCSQIWINYRAIVCCLKRNQIAIGQRSLCQDLAISNTNSSHTHTLTHTCAGIGHCLSLPYPLATHPWRTNGRTLADAVDMAFVIFWLRASEQSQNSKGSLSSRKDEQPELVGSGRCGWGRGNRKAGRQNGQRKPQPGQLHVDMGRDQTLTTVGTVLLFMLYQI